MTTTETKVPVADPTMHALRDGTTVRLREIRPDDGPRLLSMWRRTSEESRRARLPDDVPIDEATIDRYVDLDPDRQYAVVATMGRGEEESIVGVARYERHAEDPTVADFAALVEDEHQGRGIGSGLVRNLAVRAHDDGVRRLVGDVAVANERTLQLIEDVGLQMHTTHDPDGQVVAADLVTDLGDDYLRTVDAAEQQAARAAVERFLRPQRIAVVGASRDRTAIGGLVLDNLLNGGFEGVVYPVNRTAKAVHGVTAHPDLSACPEVPDLVVVCVPAEEVAAVVDEAGELGVRAVAVLSAGFAETGEAGARRQAELMDVVRGHGMRLLGPNCMGLLNGTEGQRMNATFSSTFPRPGRVAMSSQSGALGMAVLEHVEQLGLGISSFVSMGNKPDLSGNDLLSYWETDDDTDVVLLYLESFGNPRNFSRIARRVSRDKPVVVVKSGRTDAGRRAASSHTAAVSGGDRAASALFAQTGVIRTDTLQGMFDVATLLDSQPLPRGGRVAVLTNAGGPGTLAADACDANGLEVPTLSEETQARLREVLNPEAGVGNPVDLVASATGEHYERALRVLAASGEVDAIVVIFMRGGAAEGSDVATAMAEVGRDLSGEARGVVLLSVFMSKRGVPSELASARIPSYAFPEDAARALGRVAGYADWRSRPLGDVVRPDGVRPERARSVVRAALELERTPSGAPLIGRSHGAEVSGSNGVRQRRGSAGTGTAAGDSGAGDSGGDRGSSPRSVWLSQLETEAVLRAYGVPLARSRIATSPEQAAEAQRDIGAPVVVKVASPIHKTDIGGIEVDLRSPTEAAAAVERLRGRLHEQDLAQHADRFLVQELVQGVEMMVGVTHDPSFGPLLVTGMGGTLVELVRDVAIRVTPITDRDVAEMLDSLRMRPLLDGYRGAPPGDVEALTDLLFRIGALVEDVPEVVELDCNPVFVRPQGEGVVAVDVRMRVATRA